MVVRSPRQTRHLLNYVLRNDVHHGLGLRTLDPCSSAASFGGWKELQSAEGRARTREAARACVSVEARVWILRAGWQGAAGNEEKLSIGRGPRVARRGVRTSGQALEC